VHGCDGYPDEAIRDAVASMVSFEASESRANTGTGSRREGDDFERRLAAGLWDAVAAFLVARAHSVEGAVARGRQGHQGHLRISVGTRSLWIPARDVSGFSPVQNGQRWLARSYAVQEMIDNYPGTAEAVARWAPDVGPYAGSDYPELYSGLSTKFDAVVLREERATLKEKILIEYKTAKASKERQIDGNAHERLSFQAMQYLEVATRYPRCSFVVMANDAFVRYRNKYHVSFRVQADRLSCFSWFEMQHLCTSSEYLRYIGGLVGWLVG